MKVSVRNAPGYDDFEGYWLVDFPNTNGDGAMSVVWSDVRDEYFVVPESCVLVARSKKG